MLPVLTANELFVGWDVGGWNCDQNGKSRDALVVLDEHGCVVGHPWRNNLRETINASTSIAAFRTAILKLCGIQQRDPVGMITFAIDAPLGLPQALITLATGKGEAGIVGKSATNPYLFRQTERLLFEENLAPLSAIKDMIGSQTSKAMHAVAKFAPEVVSTGVWSDGKQTLMIETYPTACRRRKLAVNATAALGDSMKKRDVEDAYVCATLAYQFRTSQGTMSHPPADIPPSEGWIWLPQ